LVFWASFYQLFINFVILLGLEFVKERKGLPEGKKILLTSTGVDYTKFYKNLVYIIIFICKKYFF